MAAFAILDESRQSAIAFTLAFAAGAILAMLADTMMPEAFEHAGKAVALMTVLGFALGFAISEREPETAGSTGRVAPTHERAAAVVRSLPLRL